MDKFSGFSAHLLTIRVTTQWIFGEGVFHHLEVRKWMLPALRTDLRLEEVEVIWSNRNTHGAKKTSSPQIPRSKMSLAPHTDTHRGLVFYREAAVGISQCFPPITDAVHTLSLSLRHAKTDRCWWPGMNERSAASLLGNVPAYGQSHMKWQGGLALAVCWLAPSVCAAGAWTRSERKIENNFN